MNKLDDNRKMVSAELSNLIIEINNLNIAFLECLTLKQYNVYRSFNSTIPRLSIIEVNQITKNKALKLVQFKAYRLQLKADRVNQELDSILYELEKDL